jgi:hypothetical protein
MAAPREWKSRMMEALELISGIVLMVLTAAIFFYSLPRNGKTAWFVGTEFEGYAVVLMVGGFGLGAVFILLGITELMT